MAPPPYSLLDFQQIIQRVYDQDENRLRVNNGANITLGGELEVAIDAASGDNIAISDGTDTLAINPDGSINVVGSFTFSPASQIKIWDGTDQLAVNPDGSINVNLSGTSGSYKYAYNEVTSVATSALTTVVSYTAAADGKLKKISGSGTNIGTYSVLVNGVLKDKRRSMFGGDLNVDFNFDEGFPILSGDIVALKVIHERPYVGDFNGNIQVLED
jgi:hypothetical protein